MEGTGNHSIRSRSVGYSCCRSLIWATVSMQHTNCMLTAVLMAKFRAALTTAATTTRLQTFLNPAHINFVCYEHRVHFCLIYFYRLVCYLRSPRCQVSCCVEYVNVSDASFLCCFIIMQKGHSGDWWYSICDNCNGGQVFRASF